MKEALKYLISLSSIVILLFILNPIGLSDDTGFSFPPHSLIGVIISKGNYSSMAILKEEVTQKLVMLKEGESLYGFKLVRVLKNRIILQKNESSFQIFVGKGKLSTLSKSLERTPREISSLAQKAEQKKPDLLNKDIQKREFKRSDLEKRIASEWPLIMKETKFSPHFVNGNVSGFKITRLPKSSLLSEAGIQANDVIKDINGIKLNDMGSLFGLYDRLKNESRLEVNIERNGKLLRLLYDLK